MRPRHGVRRRAATFRFRVSAMRPSASIWPKGTAWNGPDALANTWESERDGAGAISAAIGSGAPCLAQRPGATPPVGRKNRKSEEGGKRGGVRVNIGGGRVT